MSLAGTTWVEDNDDVPGVKHLRHAHLLEDTDRAGGRKVVPHDHVGTDDDELARLDNGPACVGGQDLLRDGQGHGGLDSTP